MERGTPFLSYLLHRAPEKCGRFIWRLSYHFLFFLAASSFFFYYVLIGFVSIRFVEGIRFVWMSANLKPRPHRESIAALLQAGEFTAVNEQNVGNSFANSAQDQQAVERRRKYLSEVKLWSFLVRKRNEDSRNT